MVNFTDLEQIVMFQELGTLSAVSSAMNLSQSALTRSMKKIESEFGVTLFERTKNSMQLNEAGKIVATQASIILEQRKQMIRLVKDYDRLHRMISVGLSSPVLDPFPMLQPYFSDATVTSEVRSSEELLSGLYDGTYSLVILPFKPEGDGLACKKQGSEHLMYTLPKGHRLARRKSVSMSELNGENILLYHNIGFWESVIKEKLPDSRFIQQNDRYSLIELIENSSLPSFASDHTISALPLQNRTVVPISDPEANVDYYIVCLKENRKRFSMLFN